MVGVAKAVGGAVGQVAIQLALEKAFFNKDVEKTTKQTESAFSKSFNKAKNSAKSAFTSMSNIASKASNKIKNVFNKAKNSAKSAFTSMSNIASKASNKIKNVFNKDMGVVGKAIQAVFGYFSLKAIWDFTKASVQSASETQSAWTGLYSIVNGTGKSFSEAKGFLEEYTKDGLVPLTDAVTAYKNLASRGYETEQIEGIMTSLKDASAFGRQASYSYGEAIKSATEGLKNENSILVDNAGVTKNVAKMWDEYAESIGTTANNLTLAQKRQAEYEGIMEETKFQMGDAQKYADTYAGKLAKLNTAFYNLKVTIGQVIAPIIELFLPVITKAINALTTMFNKLKSIMSVFGLEMKEYIGGSTNSAFGDASESASGISEGLEGAGDTATKTAKKIKKAFAGVDEINVLNTKNDTSSGTGSSTGGGVDIGSGGSTSIGGLEDTTTEVTQNLEWLERSAYDWGVAFGNSLTNGLNAINWDSIQSSVVNLVSKITQFLNGAVEGTDWHLLGETLGQGFNTGLYAVYTFFDEFDWNNWGESLAQGLNGIFDSVDWKTLGSTFALKFNSIFETATGFFKELDFSGMGSSLMQSLNSFVAGVNFGEVGNALRRGIDGAIDFMWSGISTFDAEKLGEQGASLLNNISYAIQNIDWKKLGSTIQTAISKILTSARKVLKETDWGELVDNVITAIGDFLVGVDWGQLALDVVGFLWDIGVALVEGILAGIGSLIVNIGKVLWDILVQPFIDGIKKGFGIGSKDKGASKMNDTGDGIVKGMWTGISKAKDWIVEKWEKVKDWFSDITKEAKVAIKQKWSDIKEKWNNLTTNIKDKTADMKAKIATTWSDLKTKWANVTNNIKDKTASMKAKVASTWSDLKSKWNNLMDNFKDKTVSIKTKIADVTADLKGWVNKNIIDKINSKLPSWLGKIPRLAQGGWVQANNPQLAIIGDNKNEPEIVTPESKIKDQVIKGIQEVGTPTQNQRIDFTIKLEYPDGKYLIKEINDAQIKDGKISLLV